MNVSFFSSLFFSFFFFPNARTVKFLRRKVFFLQPFFFLSFAFSHTWQAQTFYLMNEGRGQSFEQTYFLFFVFFSSQFVWCFEFRFSFFLF